MFSLSRCRYSDYTIIVCRALFASRGRSCQLGLIRRQRAFSFHCTRSQIRGRRRLRDSAVEFHPDLCFSMVYKVRLRYLYEAVSCSCHADNSG